MKVSTVLVQPPSLAAQLEGKAIKAFAERFKENLDKNMQQQKEKPEQVSVEESFQEAQSSIDLLI